jgi:crossover junction endodeoxyribonuclease RusA
VIVLPWPPSVNRIWRSVNNRVLLSRDGRSYREHVMREWMSARIQGFGKSRLAVSIVAHAPDARRRDIDNICKAVLDALQHAGAYNDDSQIDRLSIRRGEINRANPHVLVTLEAA